MSNTISKRSDGRIELTGIVNTYGLRGSKDYIVTRKRTYDNQVISIFKRTADAKKYKGLTPYITEFNNGRIFVTPKVDDTVTKFTVKETGKYIHITV